MGYRVITVRQTSGHADGVLQFSVLATISGRRWGGGPSTFDPWTGTSSRITDLDYKDGRVLVRLYRSEYLLSVSSCYIGRLATHSNHS
ncbi:hypothetical protein TNCV_4887021 [Trichonephila clavipes]|uniref:Uncharacterized protein n=1 Tax=Trichonephila clavipes TaxID=2585209 RepID=A0A8X6UWT6_TRICX|nr:hypothetical protein TNCV_4887021 [Trichonephila clavipes]